MRNLLMLILAATTITGCVNMDSSYEEPRYDVTERISESVELRTYKPYVLAEVTLPGNKDDTMNEGFRTLANYIFGGNTTAAEISMTAPVVGQSTSQTSSTKIAMTAPVTGQASGNQYTIQFMMPAEYTLQTLPKPNDSRITLREQPTRKALVERFSWFMGNSKIADATHTLKDEAAKRKLTVVGEPMVAYFNPPWTLPWLRRNEVMVEVR